MKQIFIIILVLSLIFTFSLNAFGSSPVGFGARAAGMGGAYTAVADDGTAAYWNPAGISQLGYFTLTPGAGVYGSYDSSFNYDSLKNSTTFPPPIPKGNLGIPAFAGLTTKYFGANAFGDLGAFAVNGSDYIKLYGDGTVYGAISGAATFDKLSVGVNYKIVKGGTAQYYMKKVNLDPTYLQTHPNDVLQLLDPDNNTALIATGDGYALDIGLLYRLTDDLKLGFAGRNLISSVNWSGDSYKYVLDQNELTNNQKVVFDPQESPYSATTSLPRTYDFGVSYRPYKSALLAGDVEVITADDADLNQTRFHFGFEQTALWKIIALRIGAFTDKNESTIGLTAGLGFKLGPAVIDLAAIKSGDSNMGFFATAGIRF